MLRLYSIYPHPVSWKVSPDAIPVRFIFKISFNIWTFILKVDTEELFLFIYFAFSQHPSKEAGMK